MNITTKDTSGRPEVDPTRYYILDKNTGVFDAVNNQGFGFGCTDDAKYAIHYMNPASENPVAKKGSWLIKQGFAVAE